MVSKDQAIIVQAAEKRLKDLAHDVMYEALSNGQLAAKALSAYTIIIGLHERIDLLLKELRDYETSCNCGED